VWSRRRPRDAQTPLSCRACRATSTLRGWPRRSCSVFPKDTGLQATADLRPADSRPVLTAHTPTERGPPLLVSPTLRPSARCFAGREETSSAIADATARSSEPGPMKRRIRSPFRRPGQRMANDSLVGLMVVDFGPIPTRVLSGSCFLSRVDDGAAEVPDTPPLCVVASAERPVLLRRSLCRERAAGDKRGQPRHSEVESTEQSAWRAAKARSSGRSDQVLCVFGSLGRCP
jgi:hypothetical protein